VILNKDDISQWADDLEGFKPEYLPVKCFSLLCFFQLKGRTTSMVANNLEPIPNLSYTIFVPHENRYYLKEFRGYDLETLYHYRPTLTFSGEDEGVENLRRYVHDGRVWLLFTHDQVTQICVMLQRLWKSHFAIEGKLDYRTYLELLKSSIDLEDYRDYGKELVGYKTVCAQYERKIRELWDKAKNKN